MYKLHVLLSFTVILNVNMSFIPNKTTYTKYCLTQWISKLPESFEIHWVSNAVTGQLYGSGGHSKCN